MNKIYFCFLITIGFSFFGKGFSQSVPTPSGAQDHPIMLINATIHDGKGEVIQGGSILFEKGKIVGLGSGMTQSKNTEVIDLEGKHIYPGLIAMNTQLGLGEIDAVRATRDNKEVGSSNPNIRAIIGYNTDSRVTPTVKSNGVLIAQICPVGGLFSGQSSVISLDAWNWEDALISMDDGLYMNWPKMVAQKSRWNKKPLTEQKRQIKKQLQNIDKKLTAARSYLERKKGGLLKTTDLKLEVLSQLFNRKKKLFIRGGSAKQIEAIIQFKRKYLFDIVLVGGRDAGLFCEDLKREGIPVVLKRTHALPPKSTDDLNYFYELPKVLMDGGVKFCIGADGYWEVRNLPFYAGTAAAHGLSKEEALMSITRFPAEILGLDDQIGTLEVGKDATMIISEGDVLDVRSSIISMSFFQGRKLDLGNKQKDLSNKFSKKYGL